MKQFSRKFFSCAMVVTPLLTACGDNAGSEDARLEADAASGASDDGTPDAATSEAGTADTSNATDEQSDGGANSNDEAGTTVGEAGTPIDLANPIHVVAEAASSGADGSEAAPFGGLAEAVRAISDFNLAHDEVWDGQIIVHEGAYEVAETVALPPTVDIEIEPGVTLALGYQVSLHANRDVKVLGTEDSPVLFTWLDEGQPWGSFTNFEESSQDNVFSWVTFEHGGEATYQGIFVRGALSLENAGALISHCTFQDNAGDDGLSLGKSPTLVEYSSFLNNAGDAFDADGLSGGAEMAYSLFEGNVNDGIDLGEGADLYAHHNVIIHNGDKGVSVGEGSAPRIEYNLMFDNFMGVGIKDGSEPSITNNTIYANQYGIASYEAIAGLGAGKAHIKNTIIWGSKIADVAQVEGALTQFSYSCVQSGVYVTQVALSVEEDVGDSETLPLEGDGVISQGAGCDDPLFVDPEALDFHLMSTAGHWDTDSEDWVEDEQTSPCIDTGDPASDVGDETEPNGGRIDLGLWGGSSEASHSAPPSEVEDLDGGSPSTEDDAGSASLDAATSGPVTPDAAVEVQSDAGDGG